MIFSFSRSRDRSGQRLRRRWSWLPKPTTGALPPAPFLLLTLLHRITRSSPSPSSVSSARQKRNPNFVVKISLPDLRGSRRREPALGFPPAAAATTAVVFAFPGPHSSGALPLLLAAPPSPLPLRGAASAAAAEVAVAVALLAAAPPPPSLLLLRGTAAPAAVEVAAMMTLPGTPPPAPPPRAPPVAPFAPRLQTPTANPHPGSAHYTAPVRSAIWMRLLLWHYPDFLVRPMLQQEGPAR